MNPFKYSRAWLRRIPLPGVLFAVFSLAGCPIAGAQTYSASEDTGAGVTAPTVQGAPAEGIRAPGMQPLAPREVGAPVMEVPYSSLFRNTNVTLPTNASIEPTANPSIHADPFEMQSNLLFGGVGLKLPFVQRGFEPGNATLKLGPVFIKVWRVEAGTLLSDNVDLTETNRKAGVIAVLRMDLGVICQLGEGLRLAVAGSFVYLPLQGKIGPAGYGLTSVLGPDATSPELYTQMTYDTVIGGWNVQFFDELSAGVVVFSNSLYGNSYLTAIQGASFPWVDREGVYYFGAPNSAHGNSTSSDYRFNTTNDFQQYLSNEVGFQTTRMLPSDIRLSVRAIHQNLWYNQNGRGMPSVRDEVDVSAVDLRENLRFKPFVDYTATAIDYGDTVYQRLMLGAFGPITDQLSIYGSMGYFIDSRGNQNMLWSLQLLHIAGPNTTESLVFSRDVNLFGQELTTQVGYSINQVIGPSITGNLYAVGQQIEDLTGNNNSYNELLTGIKFSYFVSPRTDISVWGSYEYQYYTHYREYLDFWTGRFELDYHFTDTLIGRFLYQYRNRATNIPNNAFYENMIYVSLSKYFP